MQLLFLALAGGLFAIGLVLLVLWAVYARRAQRKKRPRLAHPIVLVHGVLGFDEVSVVGFRQEYFRGVASRIRGFGADVFAVKLPATSSVQVRAETLTRLVNDLGQKRVNLVAHSMGGLDCRYAISRLGLHARVASLTTIGTPHRGTPLADIGTGVLGDTLRLKRVAKALALEVEAFYDLTTDRMKSFNAEVPDARGVLYASVVGALTGPTRRVHPLLIPTYLYLSRAAGQNDGLVPASSQAWGEVLATINADHWAQIGWTGMFRRFDIEGLFGGLVAELRSRGF